MKKSAPNARPVRIVGQCLDALFLFRPRNGALKNPPESEPAHRASGPSRTIRATGATAASAALHALLLALPPMGGKRATTEPAAMPEPAAREAARGSASVLVTWGARGPAGADGPTKAEKPAETRSPPPASKPATARKSRRQADSNATASPATAAAPASAAPSPGTPGVPAGARPLAPLRPRYPAWSRRLGHEGRALIGARVGADGRARDVRVVASSGFAELDREAARAVREARFEPAEATAGAQGDAAQDEGGQVSEEETFAFRFELGAGAP